MTKLESVSLRAVSIELDPLPEVLGGNLFLVGFSEIEEETGRPGAEQSPEHYVPVALWVSEFPWTGVVELSPELYYFARYGNGTLPQPNDLTSSAVRVPKIAKETLSFRISDRASSAGEPQGSAAHLVATSQGPGPTEFGGGQDALEVSFFLELAPEFHTSDAIYAISVAGFEVESEAARPSPGQQPIYFRANVASESVFPMEVVLPIPKGLTILILAVKGDGVSFDDGTVRGAFLPPVKAVGGTVHYVLDTNWESSAEDIPTVYAAEGVAYGPMQLTVEMAEGLIESKPVGRVLITGSLPGVEGEAAEVTRFFWKSEEVHSTWPATFEAQMPSNLDVRVFLDQNGDNKPAPDELTGDLLPKFSPSQSRTLKYMLRQDLRQDHLNEEPFPGAQQ